MRPYDVRVTQNGRQGGNHTVPGPQARLATARNAERPPAQRVELLARRSPSTHPPQFVRPADILY